MNTITDTRAWLLSHGCYGQRLGELAPQLDDIQDDMQQDQFDRLMGIAWQTVEDTYVFNGLHDHFHLLLKLMKSEEFRNLVL